MIFLAFVFCVCAAVRRCVFAAASFFGWEAITDPTGPTTWPSTTLTPAKTTKRVGGVGDFMLVEFRIAC